MTTRANVARAASIARLVAEAKDVAAEVATLQAALDRIAQEWALKVLPYKVGEIVSRDELGIGGVSRDVQIKSVTGRWRDNGSLYVWLHVKPMRADGKASLHYAHGCAWEPR